MSEAPDESDVEFIRALAGLLQENDLTEIEVNREYGEDKCLNVRLARQITQPPAAPLAPTASLPPASPSSVRAEPATQPVESDEAGLVTSPMVGTAYLQPEPGAEPFIRLGDQVQEGQTLLIVEAMKTMNQIPAPQAGRVKRILIDDGDPVEFGAPLIVLE